MSEEIEKMRGYIQRTKPSQYDDRYQARAREILALTKEAMGGLTAESVMLAIEYGRALGLRMGRREAVSMK